MGREDLHHYEVNAYWDRVVLERKMKESQERQRREINEEDGGDSIRR